jgi:ribosomal protein S25
MDMVNVVKECAERVLKEVARSDKINILNIAGHLGERSLIVYQSIGWLAHEGRIRYLQEGNQVYVYLAENGK